MGAALDPLFGPGDLRDAQVLFVLAQAGEQAWRDDRLARLASRGHHFTAAEHTAIVEWLRAQPAEVLALWRQLVDQDGVEVSTSPYAHPIMPLLIDTGIVTDSWAPHPAPEVPDFRRPEDAAWQLETGLSFMREHGFSASGCWPPEGSVSADAVAVYEAQGVRWLVTDEGILERSLGRPLRAGSEVATELYRPWCLPDSDTALFFRDRWLSDRIGFVYGSWDDEGRAARALVRDLEALARHLPDDAAIVIALDGENPWLHYAEAGGRFLRELMERLSHAGPQLRAATLTEVAGDLTPVELPGLHPGSWINSIFATWIGHPEKTAAWRLLKTVRDAIADSGSERPDALRLAEGSDWFWWLGDDNPTELAPLYDRIFRAHLGDACREAGIEPPVDLSEPLKTRTRPVRVPVSHGWPSPTLDGRMTSYFEWSIAAWVEAGTSQPLRRLAVWGGPDRLHVLVEGRSRLKRATARTPLTVRLISPAGEVTEPETMVVDAVAETSLPWTATPGWRLEVRLGTHRLPEDSVVALEPFPVDENHGTVP
jgi:alpha-amylase/alpha-mannosidase (GH57 family)